MRKFYEPNGYALLTEETFRNLQKLAAFWANVKNKNLESMIQETDDGIYSDISNQFYILSYAPNDIWTKLMSVYFLCRKDQNDKLNPKDLKVFLDRMTAFIGLRTIVTPTSMRFANRFTMKCFISLVTKR